MRLWAGRGLHSQETCATLLLHTAIRILQSGQKSVLAVLVLISSRLRCKVNYHCAAGKTRYSKSKKPSTPPVDHI